MTVRKSHGLHAELLEGRDVPSTTVIDASEFFDFKPVNIGGGGFIQDVVYSPADSAVRYAVSDTGGAFRYDNGAGRWRQIVTVEALGLVGYPEGSYGVEALAAHPTDPDTLLLSYGGGADAQTPGNVYRSDDGGATFTPADLAVDISAGDQFDKFSKRLAFDPADPDVVYYGSFRNGLYRSDDGGASFDPVRAAGAPAGDGNVALVAFSPRGALYAATRLGDVYRSADGGASFANVSDGTAVDGAFYQDIDFAPDGTVFISENYGGITKLPRGDPANGWAEVYPDRIVTAAIDPLNPQRVFAMSPGGRLYRSTDGGDSYVFVGEAVRNSPAIPWLEVTTEDYFSTAQLTFDAADPSKLVVAQGVGVWTGDAGQPTAAEGGDGFLWTSDSAGIEMVVARDMAHTSAGVVVASEDRTAFLVTDPDATTAQVAIGLQQGTAIANGSSVSVPANDHDYVAAVSFNFQPGNFANDPAYPTFSGYSHDGGATWQRFGSIQSGAHPAPLAAGNMAVSARAAGETVGETNLVWLPKDDYAPFYSTDNGRTWRQSPSFDPFNKRDEEFQRFGFTEGHFNSYVKARYVVADPVTPGTFYMYLNRLGFWRTQDGGATWARLAANDAELPEYAFHGQLAATPGESGDLWFVTGRDPVPTPVDGVWHSPDGGETWDRLPGWRRALSVAVGAPASGSADPTVYVSGVLNNRGGVYRSTNRGADWQLMAEFPAGLHGEAYYLAASPDVPDDLYLGVAGYGFVYATPVGDVPASDEGRGGFSAPDAVTYQAEGGVIVAGGVGGWVADTDGEFVDYFGQGSSVTWDGVDGGTGGAATFTFRYANGGGTDRTSELVVNGARVAILPLPPTGGWGVYGEAAVTANLPAGENTVTLRAAGSTGPDLDSMAVVTAGAGNVGVIQIEAEEAPTPPPWAAATEGNVTYVEVAPGNNAFAGPAGEPLIYPFDIAEAGEYRLFGRVRTPNGGDNSFWVSLDGGPWQRWNGIKSSDLWQWQPIYDEAGVVPDGPAVLSAGNHEIRVAYREDGTRLDKLLIQPAGLAMPTGDGYAGGGTGGRVSIDDTPRAATIQAEGAAADPAWQQVDVGGATYLTVPNGSGTPVYFAVEDTTPRIRFTVPGSSRSDFRIRVRALAGDDPGRDDSFFVRVNGGAWRQVFVPAGAPADTDLGVFALDFGENTVEVAQREDGTMIDSVTAEPVP